MDLLLKVSLIGLISGIAGTGAGGLMAFFIKDISNRTLGFIIEFSSGLMTAVVCFELLPEAFGFGGIYLTFAGVIAGILTIIAVEEFINSSDYIKKSYKNSSLLKTGILTAIGLALHNFPEGIAVGSGFGASVELGIAITFVILVHDIPEGIAMALPMKLGGLSKFKAFFYTALTGVPMGIGAFIGAFLGGISKDLIGACLGFAGGCMIYIVLGELIPQSKSLYKGRLPVIGNILGLICGIIVSVN
ncbi:MAG TPA: ZIP family metal transporter [Pseudobacteroides sp.]|uniref:ZIP family metal transporter n=1 Tax=Pseudobacteroides sp. TaxID=1968840 RepID=UPI002F938B46